MRLSRATRRDAAATLQQIAQRHGAELVPIARDVDRRGHLARQRTTSRLKAPRVLLAWDTPASSLSAGWARYVLEQRFGQRVTAMRASTLQNFDMKDYDVLVLPSGNYTFSDDALRRLKDWIRNGGTLITLAEASRWAARDRVGLLSTDTLLRDGTPERDAPKRPAQAPRRVGAAARRRSRIPPSRSTSTRRSSPNASGPRTSPARCSASRCIRITGSPRGSTATSRLIVRRRARVRAAEARCRASTSGSTRRPIGSWPPAWCGRKRSRCSPQRAFLMHQPMGRGHVIAFAEDPNYRAYAEATQLLFINAVLLGAGH